MVTPLHVLALKLSPIREPNLSLLIPPTLHAHLTPAQIHCWNYSVWASTAIRHCLMCWTTSPKCVCVCAWCLLYLCVCFWFSSIATQVRICLALFLTESSKGAGSCVKDRSEQEISFIFVPTAKLENRSESRSYLGQTQNVYYACICLYVYMC